MQSFVHENVIFKVISFEKVPYFVGFYASQWKSDQKILLHALCYVILGWKTR